MSFKYNAVVVIGRFQIPHFAHKQLLLRALELGSRVIVVLGSASQPRSVKNPFTVEEREDMIRSMMGHAHDRIYYTSVRDYFYNDQQWVADVQQAVHWGLTVIYPEYEEQMGSSSKLKVALLGHEKDSSSYYLKMFPQWKFEAFDNVDDRNSTEIRDFYLHGANHVLPGRVDGTTLFEATAEKINIDPEVTKLLMEFAGTDDYKRLVKEAEHLFNYKKQWEDTPYPVTFTTVDAVVVQSGHVLLVRRKAEPSAGALALPGGFVHPDEWLQDAVIRELREETRLKVPVPVLKGSIKKQQVFDHPNRSLSGRTITHAYLFELSNTESLPKVKGSSDAASAMWVPLGRLEEFEDQLFEDHFAIIQTMIG